MTTGMHAGQRSRWGALRPGRRARRVILVLGALVLALALAARWKDTLAVHGSDLSRRLIGAHNTVRIEAIYFKAEDAMARLKYRLFGGGGGSPVSGPVLQREQPAAQAGSPSAAAAPSGGVQVEPLPRPAAPDAPPATVPVLYAHTASKGEGVWAPLRLTGPLLSVYTEKHPIFTTFVRPDAARPYATVTLAAFDAGSISLHPVAGTQDPGGPLGVRGPGDIPASVLRGGALIAAFNGGFRWDDGHYGMLVDGMEITPMRDGLATLASYRDGSFRFGIWGSDIVPAPDLVSARQNGIFLIDHGAVSPKIDAGGETWGWVFYKSRQFYTARTAIGLTADGRFVFAAGHDVDARTLALAMQRAGVVTAMQLDINSPYSQMALYEDQSGTLRGFNLADWMAAAPSGFFAGRVRDFVYMTIR
ncbi:MAG: phosphodiester glycosidase family protein [Chloroflexota bacterium]|nr:phosphodiester glycosidase family protein [Chloroflexota bacterium]